MPSSSPLSFRFALGASVFAVLVSAAVLTVAQVPGTPVRMSEAEKVYKPVEATTRVAEGPRTATLAPGYGRKFAADNPTPRVTITNPYMNPARALFSEQVKLQCTADGGLVVAGRAGFDADGRALGTGFWRVAPDGALTPMQTRSTNVYTVRQGARCEAPFAKSDSPVGPFTVAADGRLLMSSEGSVMAVNGEGFVTRLAGSAGECDGGSGRSVQGFLDGDNRAARFDQPSRPVEDGEGNLFVVDQRGCSVRKITPKGEVSTVLGADVVCNNKVPQEDRPILHHLAWDAVHGELVSGGSQPVARPVHDLYTLVFRIAPDGTYRRVLFGKKATRISPAKHHLDGVSAMAVDAKGRIFIISTLLLFEQRGWDALQLMRVDEAGATVVPVSGTKIPNHTWMETYPMDAPIERAWFKGSHDMCISPDGTMFVSDDILIRKIDTRGQVSTWLF